MDEAWNKRYTEDSLIEELALLERHYRDGSYKECSCVPEKHLPLIAGLSSEMMMFVGEDKLKRFYEKLAEGARKARMIIEDGEYNEVPGLTELAKADPSLEHRIKECVKNAKCKGSKAQCEVAVLEGCKASVKQH